LRLRASEENAEVIQETDKRIAGFLELRCSR
jgi:hypothetical protein